MDKRGFKKTNSKGVAMETKNKILLINLFSIFISASGVAVTIGFLASIYYSYAESAVNMAVK